MISGLIDTLLGGYVSDVAILDNESLSEIFTSSDPMFVDVLEEKRATKFNVEDGSTRSDHVVDMPIEIKITFEIKKDLVNVFEEFRDYHRENKKVSIQTRVTTYSDMLVEAIPHIESIYNFGGATIDVRFTEFKEVTPEYEDMPESSVSNKNQASTVNRGEVKGEEVKPKKETTIGGGYEVVFRGNKKEK